MEEAIFHWIFPPRNSKTPATIISTDLSIKAKNFGESPAGRFMGGAKNFATGLVGTIGSVSYIAGSEGAGAALGGTIALQFSLGEMAIGASQMVDAFSNNPSKYLHEAGSIPGLIAYSENSKYAPFFDALGQFIPSATTSGNFQSFFSAKGMVRSGLGVIDAAKTLNNAPTINNAIGLLDQMSDAIGFTLESFNLTSEMVGKNKFMQQLKYSFSYEVQKGDNLTEIAKKFHSSVDNILKENNFKDANNIKEGQKIKFSGTEYGKGSFGGAGVKGKY